MVSMTNMTMIKTRANMAIMNAAVLDMIYSSFKLKQHPFVN